MVDERLTPIRVRRGEDDGPLTDLGERSRSPLSPIEPVMVKVAFELLLMTVSPASVIGPVRTLSLMALLIAPAPLRAGAGGGNIFGDSHAKLELQSSAAIDRRAVARACGPERKVGRHDQ